MFGLMSKSSCQQQNKSRRFRLGNFVLIIIDLECILPNTLIHINMYQYANYRCFCIISKVVHPQNSLQQKCILTNDLKIARSLLIIE